MTTNCRIRFMANNFAELTSGQIQYSSQVSAFPFTNFINRFRSKAWRPSGYFNIDATNNLIYINDGTNKTATVTVDEYTTPALLATEMQTQLNVVSAGWTVTHNLVSGQYRFKFAHSSAHTIRLSQQTNAIWSTIGVMGTTDQTAPFTAQEQRNHQKEFCVFDMGYNAPITFCAVIGPIDEPFHVGTSATIKLQANNLDDWTSPPLDVTLTRTDEGCYRFLDDIADTGFRFWRFEYVDKYNPRGPSGVSLSHIYLGDFVTLVDRNVINGIAHKFTDPTIRSVSESGSMYFDKKTKYADMSSMSINYIDKDDRLEIEKLYHKVGTYTPFYVSIDPTLMISTQLPEFTKYVIFNGEPNFVHVIRDLYNVAFQLREVF